MSYMTTGSVLDKIGSALTRGANFYGELKANQAVASLANKQAEADAAKAQAPSGSPSWLMPVVALGGVAALIYFLKKKKSA